MTRKQLLEISFETDNEKKLKTNLIELLDEHGVNQTFLLLAIKNQLLLNGCAIDENAFNQILFRNYIYELNTPNELNFENFADEDKELIAVFNTCIENNNFEEAFKIFSSNNLIYQLLSTLYIKNLFKNETYKVSKIDNKQIDKVYKEISLLNDANLTIKRDKVKILQIVSTK